MNDHPKEPTTRQDELYSEEERIFGSVGELQGSPFARIWSLMPRILPYFRPHWLKGVGLVVTTALLAVLALAQPWPLAFVVDGALGEEPPPTWVTDLVGDATGRLILFGVVATIVLTLLTGLVTMANQYLMVLIQERMSLDFRADLFEHMQRLSLGYHEDSRTGMMMFRLSSQAKAIGQLVVSLPRVLQSVLTLVGMAFLAYRINPTLAVVALGVVPFIYYSITVYMNRVEPQLMRVRGMEGTNFSIVHESLSMLRVIRAFGRERHEYDRFRDQGERTVDARVDLTVRQTLFRLGVNLIIAIGTAAVLGVGAYQVLDGELTIGQLLVVLSYIAATYQPLEQLTGTAASFQQFSIGVDHSLRIMDVEPDVVDREGARSLDRCRGAIRFENVRFDYPSKPSVLDGVSFELEAGETLAVVGPTGAGKSTLVSLLPRFFDPTQGSVFLDGVDLREYRLEDLREQFGIVLQEPLLFAGSIRDNIRYGRLDADQKAVREAAQQANAHEFIVGLPKRYDTALGERGAKISGGERQRVSVARAFLRDAPVLILDEPTSSIDSQTEDVILEALDRLMEGRTTIVIAHRLSTLRSADRVLVLDHGRAVQFGTHDDLIGTDGLYRKLWESQTGQLELLSLDTATDALSVPHVDADPDPAPLADELPHEDPTPDPEPLTVRRVEYAGHDILVLAPGDSLDADEVIHVTVLDGGDVIEAGSARALQSLDGVYASFVRAVFESFLEQRRRTMGDSEAERRGILAKAATASPVTTEEDERAVPSTWTVPCEDALLLVVVDATDDPGVDDVLYGAVLEDGRVVAADVHERLLDRDRRYRDLWSRDFLRYEGQSNGDGRTARTRPLRARCEPLPGQLSIEPRSRRPLELEPDTVREVLRRPVPTSDRPLEDPVEASVLVPVRDNLVVTRLALESVLASTKAEFEVVVVDNDSAEPTRQYLRSLAAANDRVVLIRNEENLGFAHAVNAAASIARGEALVILNNDVIVPEHWLDRLLDHVADPAVGIIGPRTNRCGNEAELTVTYHDLGGLTRFAAERATSHARQRSELDVVIMFCAAIRREVFDSVGPLDTSFGMGYFEDDDYSRRVRATGLGTMCADDVFVHHFGEASFGALVPSGERSRIFDESRRRFEDKWGISWRPHRRSANDDYDRTVERVRAAVSELASSDATVLVVSRGDDRIVDIRDIDARHFPQGGDGGWSGHHPADDRTAIEELESLRAFGATHLVVPATASWWRTHYAGFFQHLEDHHRPVLSEPEACWIYELERPRT